MLQGISDQNLKVSVKENEVPTEKILVARVFSLQRKVIYQIKAKRLNYLIKDFILSNLKRRLSFFALELRGIEFTAEAPALSRC